MSLLLSQLSAHAARALEEDPRRHVLAYACPEPWTGGTSIVVGDRTLPLRYCESALQVRETLSEVCDSPQVLLVSLPENKLGQDVLARVARHGLLHVDRWELVQQVFAVRQVDPRLFGLAWMPQMLLESANCRPQNASPVLTQASAMATCLSYEFGLGADRPSLEDFVQACEAHAPRWLAIPQERRDAYREYLIAQLGSLAAVFVSAMENGTGDAIVAIGLACEVLYSDEADQEQRLREARIRLEARLGGYRLTPNEGRQWAGLAVAMAANRAEAQSRGDDRKATDLLAAIGAGDFLGSSSVLASGFDARLAGLGDAIEQVLRNSGALISVNAAAQQVSAHAMSSAGHAGAQAAQMAARLCRSLETGATPDAVDPVTSYLASGAWQDWARRALRGVRPEPFARAVKKLLDHTAQIRRKADEAFAESLVEALRIGDLPAQLTPIECALDEIVAPLARHLPVLLVLLDGMSADVALAIGRSLESRDWSPWARSGKPRALLATVPSVTEFSRCSLFSGRLAAGSARHEARWFAEHPTLRRTCRAEKPPMLFHKASVEHSQQLSAEVAEAIADASNRVVAVVINAIDDALAKSDQIRIDWDIDTIPLLAEVLDHARLAGRAVVLTSDHGHVLERDSTLIAAGPGERYRNPDTAPAEGELLAMGARVRAVANGDVVVPWREDIRYAAKKNGYHGGVSRQEMIVPLSIWTAMPSGLPDDEYQLAGRQEPAWWSGASPAAQPAPTRGPASGRRRSRTGQATPDLFASPVHSTLAERLASSSALEAQQTRLGRMALDTKLLTALVGRLDESGGRASIEQLASAVQLPMLRLRGVVSILERTLNLDGFPVVTIEHATGTVLLDRKLLEKQFQI